MKQIPIAVTGMVLPLATFLNIQSISIPGWAASGSFLNHCSPKSDRPDTDPVYYYPITSVFVFSILSVVCGVIGNTGLFIRMLEKKIKANHRVMMGGSFGQGLFGILALIVFGIELQSLPSGFVYTEAPLYTFIAALASFLVFGLLIVQQSRNQREAHYDYTLLDLSPPQRQLILLTMCSIGYTLLLTLLYSYIEKWSFDDTLYWVVSTLTTIGYGDIAPKTGLGQSLLPILAFFGIALVGSNIWSVRHVLLEILTHRLAFHYARSFGLSQQEDETPFPPGYEIVRSHGGRYSVDLSPSRHGSRSQSRHSLEHSLLDDRSLQQDPESVADGSSFDLNGSASPYRLSRSYTTPVGGTGPSKTVVISRSKYLPQLTIVGGSDLRRRHVVETTKQIFRFQIMFALIVEIMNLLVFGSIFAYIEQWSFLEGIYFASTSLLTIGYGDYVLCRMLSRSIFIWYAFLGIAATTYFGSMLSEYAMDQWTVTVDKIEKRVDRYEKKAQLKRLYGKQTINGTKEKEEHPVDVDEHTSPPSSPEWDIGGEGESEQLVGMETNPLSLTRSPRQRPQPSSLPTFQSFIRLQPAESSLTPITTRFYPTVHRSNPFSNVGGRDTDTEEDSDHNDLILRRRGSGGRRVFSGRRTNDSRNNPPRQSPRDPLEDETAPLIGTTTL